MSVESEESTPLILISPVITAKDPKKVEQGKRLAAISKEAKERKMRAKIREEEFSYLPWVGYTIAGFSSLGLLYLLLFKKDDDVHLEKTTHVMESPPVVEEPKKKSLKLFKNF